MTKTIVAINLFLFIYRVHYNKTITNSATIYLKVKGFDNRYFLHLEDADFTRMCSYHGIVIHDPTLKVIHKWARGSHKSIRQMLCLLISLFKYFRKWGFVIF